MENNNIQDTNIQEHKELFEREATSILLELKGKFSSNSSEKIKRAEVPQTTVNGFEYDYTLTGDEPVSVPAVTKPVEFTSPTIGEASVDVAKPHIAVARKPMLDVMAVPSVNIGSISHTEAPVFTKPVMPDPNANKIKLSITAAPSDFATPEVKANVGIQESMANAVDVHAPVKVPNIHPSVDINNPLTLVSGQHAAAASLSVYKPVGVSVNIGVEMPASTKVPQAPSFSVTAPSVNVKLPAATVPTSIMNEISTPVAGVDIEMPQLEAQTTPVEVVYKVANAPQNLPVIEVPDIDGAAESIAKLIQQDFNESGSVKE